MSPGSVSVLKVHLPDGVLSKGCALRDLPELAPGTAEVDGNVDVPLAVSATASPSTIEVPELEDHEGDMELNCNRHRTRVNSGSHTKSRL